MSAGHLGHYRSPHLRKGIRLTMQDRTTLDNLRIEMQSYGYTGPFAKFSACSKCAKWFPQVVYIVKTTKGYGL